MSDRLDIRLLDRFLTGTASREEMTVVRRWLAAHPDQVLAETRNRLAADEASWDVDAAWLRLQERLAAGTTEPSAGHSEQAFGQTAPSATSPRPIPVLRLDTGSRRRRAWVGAGGLLAAAMTTLVLWQADVFRAATGTRSGAPLAEMATSAGQRATLRLPDGTTVRLDAGSRLRYPSRMPAGAARELALEGQAYFDVAHDPTRPFLVRAGGALVRDVGTQFAITAYPGSSVSVVVARGSVAVRPRGEVGRDRMLQPGQLARIDAAGAVAVQTVDVRAHIAWTEGILAFDARPLRDVAPELGRWYGVEIAIPDPGLAARPLTAEFRDEQLPQVLDAIAMALGAHWQRHGGTIVFAPGSRP